MRRVSARQGNDDVAVAPLGLGIEDLGGCARRVCFGEGPGAELADRAGQLWWSEEALIAVDDIALRGLHNRRNAAAAEAATPGEVVLLSPACASFDQFEDFEARGRAFKEMVAARRT